MVDEEMDGVAHEQRKKLESIESELAEVKQWLDRLYRAIETTDLDISDIAPRIREHRERERKLQDSARDVEATLAERRVKLDNVETITAFALDMGAFLKASELTERRAFIQAFVKQILVGSGKATIRYSIPVPEDSALNRSDTGEVTLPTPVPSTVRPNTHERVNRHRAGYACQESLGLLPCWSCHYSLAIASASDGASYHRLASNCHSVPNAIYFFLDYDGTGRTIGSLDPRQRIESPSCQPSYLNTPAVHPVDRNRVYSRLARRVSALGNTSNAAILSVHVFVSVDGNALCDLPFAVHTEEDTL